MRLGEIKKILEEVLDDGRNIVIQNEPLFGGQAYQIKNFHSIISVLDILADQSWNNSDYTVIETIKSEFNIENQLVQLPKEQFDKLNSYIQAINPKIPLYYSILETMAEEQEEQIINIKLPEKSVGSLSDLAKLNNRLDDIFKKFNIDGNAEFRGFDLGTDWYMVCFAGVCSYQSFIACLKIAQEYYKVKAEYYKSETAKLDYEASLNKVDDYSDNGLEKYTLRRLELIIESKVRDAMGSIDGRNGKTEPEMCTQLVIATKDLVKELGAGVEFHLSLNPPKYAEETGGALVIHYNKIRELKEKGLKPKQLKESKENKEEDVPENEAKTDVK